MSESIALELSEPLVKKVKEIAALNRQGIKEMLIEWIDRIIIKIIKLMVRSQELRLMKA